MTRLTRLVRRVLDSFWFLPTLLTAVAVAGVEALVAVDRRADVADWSLGGLLLEVGADGSRSMLSAIATSMLAAAATSFSITIAVLALTSSTYGPRLVRNFLADRGNQYVLAVLVAVAVYALLLLRHIRVLDLDSDESAFVPHLAVNVAMALAIVGVGSLVYFIHHVSVAIQVSSLSSRVRGTVERLADDLFPEDQPTGSTRLTSPLVDDGGSTVPMSASRGGYVQVVDGPRILRMARQRRLLVRVLVAPGDFCLAGQPLARVRAEPGAPLDADAVAAARSAVLAAVALGDSRTPDQDLRFALGQHVDLAVRALSPGVNDPITAMNALDDLSAGLAAVAARPEPADALLDETGVARVQLARPTIADLLTGVVDHLAVAAAGQPTVARHLVRVLERVAWAARDPRTVDLTGELAEAVLEHVRRTGPTPADLGRLGAQVAALRSRAGGAHPMPD